MTIRYGLSHQANDQFYATLDRLATQRPGMRLCELGGGANPAVPHDIVEQFEMDYTVVDVCEAELDKAPAGFRKIQADITQPQHGVEGPFDLVFSVWCAEHVSDGAAFHQAIFELLAPGGAALHIFPTLYAPPFVVNRLIPECLSAKLVLWLQPHRAPEGDHGKFPALYSWCRGPSPAQLRRLKGIGYVVEEYAGFFGHSGSVAFGAGYLDRIPPLCRLHEATSRWLARHPISSLTTIAYMVLRKGGRVSGGDARAVSGDEPGKRTAGSVGVLD